MRRYRRHKRRSSRTETWFKVFLAFSVAIALTVSVIVAAVTGKDKFDTTLFLIIFFVSLVVIATIGLILSIPSVKGNRGERSIARLLDKIANNKNGYTIHDVIIPSEDGGTSQLDHILFLKNKIFVIETKNYSGRIYGKDDQREWTQVLAYGHTKNKFYNPVKQNLTHVYRLKEIINKNIFIESCVVFVKGNTQFIESEYVYTPRELIHYILETLNNKEIVSDVQLEEIYKTVQNFKDNPIQTNKEHIQEIRQMQKDVRNNICPRCGGDLVLRYGKDGNKFYGCSNYPKCKFTKKARG